MMAKAKENKIVVVGAGIVGVSTAIWLRRSGKDVTLIDKGVPGQGTSFGNAGLLAASSIVPVTVPGLIPKSPKYLFDPNFPLFLRWSYLPRLAPWLIRFLSHANDKDTRRIATALTPILGDTVEQHQALARGTRAEKWVVESDVGYAYADRAGFDDDAYSWGLRREAGFIPELIEGRAVQEREPCLSPDITLLAVMKNHGYILDPGQYVADLADELVEMGGTVLQAEVRDFDLTSGCITAVETDKGRIDCENAILTAGVWSKPLMKKLGLNIPLESERGHHILYKNPSVKPSMPIMITTGKFVATPMAMGLRCAGTVELGGLKAGQSKAPLAFLRKKVTASFPELKAESEEEWLGHRPSTTDSLPLIGEIRGTGVYAGFGHQHIGLTAGPKTGRLIADLINGKKPNIDLSPYDTARFR